MMLYFNFYFAKVTFFHVTQTRGSRWSPKEFHILIATLGDESGFSRFLRASLKKISLEGTRRKQLPLGIFAKVNFFHTSRTCMGLDVLLRKGFTPRFPPQATKVGSLDS